MKTQKTHAGQKIYISPVIQIVSAYNGKSKTCLNNSEMSGNIINSSKQSFSLKITLNFVPTAYQNFTAKKQVNTTVTRNGTKICFV